MSTCFRSFVLAMRFKTPELQVKGRNFYICLPVAFLPPPGDILKLLKGRRGRRREKMEAAGEEGEEEVWEGQEGGR